eukprot:gb/GEZN01010713.1/.p1 GENE.gb/GEZN01010713.1/~~gb/GEZN01010713.1/.p1  ORF type:complete len:122 (+),score=3.98 gb/GEZN01010713.1/:745-1110(+)
MDLVTTRATALTSETLASATIVGISDTRRVTAETAASPDVLVAALLVVVGLDLGREEEIGGNGLHLVHVAILEKIVARKSRVLGAPNAVDHPLNANAVDHSLGGELKRQLIGVPPAKSFNL